MKTERFLKDLSEMNAADLERSRARAKVVVTGKADPTEALAKLVMQWPPRDVRLDEEYTEDHEVLDTSDIWLQDVVSGIRLREDRRVPGEGVFVVSMDFTSNMAEYERFNSVVEDHNELWYEAGGPEDKIDGWTGDISPVEGYVDFARPGEDIPRRGDGAGPLDLQRPSPVRSSLITVEYRASERGGRWTLGFVARDKAGKALCWNVESGSDLARLVRRATQMLYGNYKVVGNEGPLSDGFALLAQGRKVTLCESRNDKPSWMTGAVKRGVSTEYVGAKVEEVAGKVGFNLFGFLLPTTCIIGMLVWAAICINHTWSDVPGPLAGMGWFVVGEVVLSLVLWASAAFATHAQRMAEAAKMKSAYL